MAMFLLCTAIEKPTGHPNQNVRCVALRNLSSRLFSSADPPIQPVRQTFERLAVQNKIPSPGSGRIKPFHNDMFAVGIIATKLYDGLGYFAMDDGLGQTARGTKPGSGETENSAVHLGLSFWRGVFFTVV